MMNQNMYKHPPTAPMLLTPILEEITRAPSSQVAVDELGLAIATHVGIKRDRNEDRVAVARIAAPNIEMYTVAIVCDGVGGSESGDQAAALAIASIIANLAQQQTRPPLSELAVDLVKSADDLVRKELQGRGATTLVMLLASASGHIVCANVGDSRAYSWNLDSEKLNQVTIDDTIENELKDLPGNGADLIKARGLQGRLSQAIGESGRTADELRVQTYSKENFQFGAVIGSDGLWRAARDFETSVANSNTPIDAVRRAIALANWVGGVDNASIIAISDVEQLCGTQQVQASARAGQMDITLWLSSVKIKIPTYRWIPETKSVPPPPSKQVKQRSKGKRKEPQREAGKELQLSLEPVDSIKMRPKIEVSNDKPDKT